MQKSWNYLLSEAFLVRHSMAAHYMRELPLVIEVGSYRHPITWFLPPEQRTVCIDPLIESQVGKRHSFIDRAVQDVQLSQFTDIEFGLVVLGLDLNGAGAVGATGMLTRWCKKAVIEYALNWEKAGVQFSQILALSHKQIAVQMILDLAGNDFGDLHRSYPVRPKRRFVVLR